MKQLELLVDGQNTLGECVLWCERGQRVFWTDIEGQRLYSVSPCAGLPEAWAMPERLCCFAFTCDEHVLLLGLATRLAFFHLQTQRITEICAVEADVAITRVNDGRCDRDGRFVFGTLDQSASKSAIGSFYRLNHDLALERLPLPQIAIANSICFSHDGQSMYFCDSTRQIIQRWDGYASGDSGQISQFADLRGTNAFPDGATIDAEGCLWSAQWGSGRVARYASDGQLISTHVLPVSQPSCVALGGAGLDQLFVTTAREHLSPEALLREPLAGGLFHAALAGVQGMPELRFGGRLP